MGFAGFVVAVVWIYSVANEIVNVLQVGAAAALRRFTGQLLPHFLRALRTFSRRAARDSEPALWRFMKKSLAPLVSLIVCVLLLCACPKVIGDMLGINRAILGITVLAWGNSIGGRFAATACLCFLLPPPLRLFSGMAAPVLSLAAK